MGGIKTYSELLTLDTFLDRFEYLKLDGNVGSFTFGSSRYINQKFYKSREWKRIRDEIIIRDNGCDLGILDRAIYDRIYVHHMNPIRIDDIQSSSDFLLNPEYLICTSSITHNAIHYGDSSLLLADVNGRKPNDTCPWKNGKGCL